MKKIYSSIVMLCMLILAGCEPDVTDPSNSGDNTTADKDTTQVFTQGMNIAWEGSYATVNGEIDGVSVTSNENGYVVITSTAKAVKYNLSGNGTGQFKLYSDYKYEMHLNGLTLTCNDGSAINSQCKKKGYIVLTNTNELKDGSSYADSGDEDQKAALYSEGQLIFSGTGSLTVTGNYKHALASDDYIQITAGTIDLKANVSDGLHTNDGITIDGGNITINAAGEGLQCDSGTIAISGGTLAINSVDKGILSQNGAITISGGDIQVTTTGSEGKGIKAVGDLTISGGQTIVLCKGSASSNVSAWGPGGGGHGGGGNPGGGSSGPEGIESKAAITISGGEVYAYSPDDAINAGGDLKITGGYVCAHSTGNDGIDSNGDCYIDGGIVYAISAGSPEVGIDANSEERKQLYVTGGTLVAIGGLESGSSLSQTCYSASSWSKSTWYALYKNGEPVLAFKTPASGGTTMVVSTGGTTTMKSGVTASGTSIFNATGYAKPTVTGGNDVSLSKYSGSSRW